MRHCGPSRCSTPRRRTLLKALVLPARFVAAFAALGLAQLVREPAFAAERPLPLLAALVLATIVLATQGLGRMPAAGRDGMFRRRSGIAASLMAGLALLTAAATEGRFQWDRNRVLTAEPELVARLGRHIVAGWRDPAEIRALAARGAIGGIFITRHNVAGQSAAEVADFVAVLQEIRRARRLPPLIVATDQEGGRVARLSPPLPKPLTLREVARAGGAAAVRTHGREQGRQLADVGVTLNFAPVVDLDFGIDDPADRYSRITERAIGRDPTHVTEIAGAYCNGLAEAGVACTLKHFPGLGRARGDTHRGAVELAVDRAALEAETGARSARSAAGRVS